MKACKGRRRSSCVFLQLNKMEQHLSNRNADGFRKEQLNFVSSDDLRKDDSLFFYQPDAKILYFNTFITFLHMFRALLCSSSGSTIVLTQHLLCSPLVTCALNSRLS